MVAGSASEPLPGPGSRVLIFGEPQGLAEALRRRLGEAELEAVSCHTASDAEAHEAIDAGHWAAIAVMTRDDAFALRLTLLCSEVRPATPLWANLFDRTTMEQLHAAMPHVHIVPTAELAAATSRRPARRPGCDPVRAGVPASASSTARWRSWSGLGRAWSPYWRSSR